MLTATAFVLATESQSPAAGGEEKSPERCQPCRNIPRPGRRPCCPNSSVVPPPLPPVPCPCCPPPPSDYWCPCDCVSSSSTICPPPPIPVPPCPVYCCDSTEVCESSSSSSSCHYRRVPVPRPFIRQGCRPRSSSSSCCEPRRRCVRNVVDADPNARFNRCPTCPRRARAKMDGDMGEEDVEVEDGMDVEDDTMVVDEDEHVAVQNDEGDLIILSEKVALADGEVPAEKRRCSSTTSCDPCARAPTCCKKQALQIVFQLDRTFVKLINKQNLADLYLMLTPAARYAMITPNADLPTCSRVVGPLTQFLPNYIGSSMTSVFQDIAYNKDGSVTIHTLDVMVYGPSGVVTEDAWRTYRAESGCQYKLDYLNGVNWLCK